MDIFSRAPTVSEDTVAYELYVSPAVSQDKAAVAALATLVQNWADAQLPGHIWHRDAFELKIVPSEPRKTHGKTAASSQWMIEGRMRIGDCVDDEWLVVWLLREASRQWDIVVSIFDTDGEFLLIEAADSLPSWVTPSNAVNRVWIQSGTLHLVPLEHMSPSAHRGSQRSRYLRAQDSDDEGATEPSEESDFITIDDAVALVRSPNVLTVANEEVQQQAFRRIAGYPQFARQHIQVARVHLPVDIARALAGNPALVQKASEAFYTRDALQLRAASRMTRFPPQSSIVTTIRLTRTAYAQLSGQQFFPPKPFGRFDEPRDSPEWRWRDMGMKIACGFEMLYQESKGRSEIATNGLVDSSEASAARMDALRRNPDYSKYVSQLVAAGYFQGHIEGSQAWKEREEAAARAFVENLRNDDATRPSFAALVNGALQQVNESQYQRAQQLGEDDDRWMNVSEQDVDTILEQRASATAQTPARARAADDSQMDVDDDEDGKVKQTADRLRNLAQKVESFVGGRGDVDGAMFDDEHDADSDDDDMAFSDGIGDMDSDEDSDDDGRQKAKQAAMDKLVPPLADGEYGQMPASYYANSQRVAPGVDVDGSLGDAGDEEDNDAKMKESGGRAETSPSRAIRAPILARDRYDGVDSDDESDPDDDGDGKPDLDMRAKIEDLEDDEEGVESEEDRPVIGDGEDELEVDMEVERDEFLTFAREALGIDGALWDKIVKERVERGAYVPSFEKPHSTTSPALPSAAAQQGGRSTTITGAAEASPAAARSTVEKDRVPNQSLNTFEKVMDAMDHELAKARAEKHLQAGGTGKRSGPAKTAPPTQPQRPPKDAKGKGKVRFDSPEPAQDAEMDFADIEAAMEAEFREALLRDEADGDGEGGEGDLEPGDYGMIKNFLESFKAQQGLAGPVSALAGRLEPGWQLPRDNAE